MAGELSGSMLSSDSGDSSMRAGVLAVFFKAGVADLTANFLVPFVLVFFNGPWHTLDGCPPEQVLHTDMVQEETMRYN